MLEVLAKALSSILRSLFVSLMMFIIGYSVITGEFPPNFSRLKTTFQNLQEMTQLSRQVFEQQKNLKQQMAAQGMVDEKDVAALEELNLKRAELGAGLLGGSAQQIQKIEIHDNQELRRQVKELETQVLRLQQRVSQLEQRQIDTDRVDTAQ